MSSRKKDSTNGFSESLKRVYDYIKNTVSVLTLFKYLSIIASAILVLLYYILPKLGFTNSLNADTFILYIVSAMSVYIITSTHKIELTLKSQAGISSDICELKKTLSIFHEIYKLYTTNHSEKITSAETYDFFKDQQVKRLEKKLKGLVSGHIEDLTPEETFELSNSVFKKLKKGDKVMAVTFLNDKGEWEDNPQWNEYLDNQISAAKNGATIERIFITTSEKLNVSKELRVVKIHTKEQFETTKLHGLFLDIGDYNSNIPVKIRKDVIKEGFMLINSKSERMAVTDHFDSDGNAKTLGYRTNLVFATDKLNNYEDAFKMLKARNPPDFDTN